VVVAAPLLAISANGVAQAATSYNIQNEQTGQYITANGHGHQLTTGGTPAAFLKINCQGWTDPQTGSPVQVCELEIGSGSGECIDQATLAPAVTAAYEETCVKSDHNELFYLSDFKMINVHYTEVSRNHEDLYAIQSSNIETEHEYQCSGYCDWKFSALP
jgi:hypothetical protein